MSRASILKKIALYLVLTWGTLFLLASGRTSWTLWVVLSAFALSAAVLTTFFRFRGWPFYPGKYFRLIVVRTFWYIQIMLPITAGAGLLGLLGGLLYGLVARSPTHAGVRSAFTFALSAGRTTALVTFMAFALFLIAGYIGSRQLRVRRLIAYIPSLPSEFEGFTIAQLSDLHVGPHLSGRFLARVAALTQSLNADVIAVTGDLIDDRAEDVAEYARWFGALRAPHGVFAIPGNHDVYAGWPATEAGLRAIDGLDVLVNESRIIRRGAASLAIAGTGDPAAGGRGPFGADGGNAAPDIGRTLAGVPDGMTVIALAHNPALWPALAQRDVALTLSGHTHWGQLAVPSRAWDAASLFLKHSMGFYSAGDSLLYIHPGTGYWGLPFRLGATAQVAVVELRRGAPSISDDAPQR